MARGLPALYEMPKEVIRLKQRLMNNTRSKTRGEAWSWLALPATAFLVAFFGISMVLMTARSVTDPGIQNYSIFANPLYLKSLLQSLYNGILVAVATTACAYVYVYLIITSGKALRGLLIGVVVFEFGVNYIARAYGWYVLLNPRGVINSFLQDIGLISSPLPLMKNTFGMVVGTGYALFPFAVLVLYAALSRFDVSLLNVSQSLGASRVRSFWAVYFPNSIAAIGASVLTVFLLTLGFYITPTLLGSSNDLTLVTLIVMQAQTLGNFGRSATLGIMLLVVVLLVLGLAAWLSRLTVTNARDREGSHS